MSFLAWSFQQWERCVFVFCISRLTAWRPDLRSANSLRSIIPWNVEFIARVLSAAWRHLYTLLVSTLELRLMADSILEATMQNSGLNDDSLRVSRRSSDDSSSQEDDFSSYLTSQSDTVMSNMRHSQSYLGQDNLPAIERA